jgi:hypothetical protein
MTRAWRLAERRQRSDHGRKRSGMSTGSIPNRTNRFDQLVIASHGVSRNSDVVSLDKEANLLQQSRWAARSTCQESADLRLASPDALSDVCLRDAVRPAEFDDTEHASRPFLLDHAKSIS